MDPNEKESVNFLQKRGKLMKKMKSKCKDLDCCKCFQTKLKEGSYFIIFLCVIEFFTEKQS